MKRGFTGNLIKRLIMQKNFILAADESGNPVIDSDMSILTQYVNGSFILLEILDGDKLTSGEITERLVVNRNRLSGLNVGDSHYVMELFVFDKQPENDKFEAIISGQFGNVMQKRFLKCLSINLSDGKTMKHYKTPLTDFGILKAAGSVASEGYPEEFDMDGIILQMEQKKQEYREAEAKARVKVPLLTYTLIGINLLAAALLFLYSQLSGLSYGELILTYGAKINSNILNGEYWRFITPVFLHAGIPHLLVNCYSLYAVGVTVEKIYGRYKFLVIYFIAGIFGNILSFMFSSNPGVGASGAIFGLLGALLFFGLERPALFKSSFGANIVVMIVINLFYGFSKTGIDNFAHIGGLIGGFLATGAVSGKKALKWYMNRYAYIALSILLAFSGIYYGFNGKEGRITAKTNELEALQTSNDWTRAETLAEEILAMGPDKDTRIQTLWTLIYVEEMGQKFDEAVGHANDLIALDPLSGHYVLGFVYFDMGRYDSSREELLKAKEMGATAEQIAHIDRLLDELEGLTDDAAK